MIGTSGYDYKGWKVTNSQISSFYEKGDSLSQYVKHFNYVEINSTFYRVPSLKAVLAWKNKTPDDFSFVIKVNNCMTQYKKLVEWDVRFPEFYDLMSNLEGKLKGFLVQLPPTFTNSNRKSKIDGLTPLERVVKAARFTKENYDVDIFVEFRHPSWFCDEVYDALRGLWSIVVVNTGKLAGMTRGFSPPISDFPKALTVEDTIMFRNHGTWTHQEYCGAYSDDEFATMMTLFQEKTIVSFDNTDSFLFQIPFQMIPSKMMFSTIPHAISDAKRLIELNN